MKEDLSCVYGQDVKEDCPVRKSLRNKPKKDMFEKALMPKTNNPEFEQLTKMFEPMKDFLNDLMQGFSEYTDLHYFCANCPYLDLKHCEMERQFYHPLHKLRKAKSS